jgi:hypothetical protein
VSKKISKNLVVDTSVARSSGRGDTQDTISKGCREFLLVMRDNTKHQVVMSDALELEWSKHESKFARIWLISMEKKRRVFHTKIPTHGKLRYKVERIAEKPTECNAMLKDMLLIEAALHTDRIVVSLDETVRKLFQQATEKILALKRIAWVNPCKSEETSIDWLQNGAELERERLLGYHNENSAT